MAKDQFNRHEDHFLLPAKTKAAYGMVGFGESMLQDVVNAYIILFYNTILKVPITWASWAFAGTRLWDAVSDPLMGHISDNTRSRWGRRRPYILFGGICLALSFCAMCIPPKGLSPFGLALYLGFTALLYFTFFTVTIVPAGGLGAELTLDYHERTRLNAVRTLLGRIAGIIAASSWFMAGRFPSFEQGFVVVGVGFGLLSAGAFVTAFLGTREDAEVQQQARVPFVQGLRMTLANKPFWMLSLMVFFWLLGLMLGFPVGGYVNIYYIYGGDNVAAGPVMFASGLVFNMTCLLAVFPIAWLGLRIGKERAMLLAMVLFCVAPPLTWLLFNPEYPYLQLIFQAIAAVSLIAVITYAGAMMADLVDLDEVVSHRRREGFFGAGMSFVMKLATPAGTLGFAYLMDYWAKFKPEQVVQTPSTILRLRLTLVIMPLIPCATAALLALFYPVRERHIREARALLEKRRAQRLKMAGQQDAGDLPNQA